MKGYVKDVIKDCVLVSVSFYVTILILNLFNVISNLVFRKN